MDPEPSNARTSFESDAGHTNEVNDGDGDSSMLDGNETTANCECFIYQNVHVPMN
jgi:hypothetical protein